MCVCVTSHDDVLCSGHDDVLCSGHDGAGCGIVSARTRLE